MENKPSLDEIFSNSSTPVQDTTQQEKPSLDSIFSDSSPTVNPWEDNSSPSQPMNAVDYVVQPIQDRAVEVIRGLASGAAGMAGKIDAVNDLVRNKTGINITDVFANAEQDASQFASSLPTTDIPDKWIWNLVGQTPSLMAEFAGTGGGVGSIIARAAILGAADEYNKTNEDMSLVKGAATGAVTTAAMAGGLALTGVGLTKLSEIVGKYGPTASKALIKQITNRADDEVETIYKNLNNYNLNTKVPVKTSKEVADLNKFTYDDMKKKMDDDVFQKTQELRQEHELAVMKSNETLGDKKQIFNEAMQDFDVSSTEKIMASTQKMNEAIARNATALNEEAVSVYSGALKKFQSIDEAYGKNVASVERDMINKYPQAGVPTNSVVVPELRKSLTEFAKENPSYVTTKTGKNGLELVPVRPEYKQSVDIVMKELSSLSKDFSSVIPLRILQSGKEVFKAHADMAYKMGENDAAKMFERMAKSLNPANYAGKATEANQELFQLAKVNKEFSVNRDSYKELIANLYTKDANGKLIPQPNTVFNAFAGKDPNAKVLLDRISNAEKNLKPEDKVLDKLRQVYERTKKSNDIEKEALIKIRSNIKKDRLKLRRDTQESIGRMNKESRNMTVEEKYALNDVIRNTRAKADEQLDTLQRTLDERLRFTQDQDAMRALRPPSESVLRIGQNFAGYGLIGSIIHGGNPALMAGNAAMAAGLSPRNLVKVAKGLKNNSPKVATSLDNIGKKVMNQRDLLKLLSGKAIN